MEFYIEKVYCNMKKLFSTVSEIENVYNVYFIVFNHKLEINRKLLKK